MLNDSFDVDFTSGGSDLDEVNKNPERNFVQTDYKLKFDSDSSTSTPSKNHAMEVDESKETIVQNTKEIYKEKSASDSIYNGRKRYN